jgi:hypothetical protein
MIFAYTLKRTDHHTLPTKTHALQTLFEADAHTAATKGHQQSQQCHPWRFCNLLIEESIYEL